MAWRAPLYRDHDGWPPSDSHLRRRSTEACGGRRGGGSTIGFMGLTPGLIRGSMAVWRGCGSLGRQALCGALLDSELSPKKTDLLWRSASFSAIFSSRGVRRRDTLLRRAASLSGMVPELVEDGVRGRPVLPKDRKALAKALQRLIRAPKLRRRMGEAGREKALREFTLDRMLRKTARTYEEVVRKKRS